MQGRHYHIIDYAIIIASCDGGVGGRQQAADGSKETTKARGRLENSNPSQKQQPTHHFHRGARLTCFCCCKNIAADRDREMWLLWKSDEKKKEETNMRENVYC